MNVLKQCYRVLLSKMCLPEEAMGALLIILTNIRPKLDYLLQKPSLPWSHPPCPRKQLLGGESELWEL